MRKKKTVGQKIDTCFEAECLAIQELLIHVIKRQKYRGKSTVMFTDSQAVLKALDNTYSKPEHRRIQQTQNLLWKLFQEDTKIQLAWVPGHVGLPENEEADKLAKEAPALEDPGQETKVEKIVLNGLTKQALKERRRNEWPIDSKQHKGKRKRFMTDIVMPGRKKMKTATIPKHEVTTTMNKLRTGHNNLPAHRFRPFTKTKNETKIYSIHIKRSGPRILSPVTSVRVRHYRSSSPLHSLFAQSASPRTIRKARRACRE